MRVKLIAEKRQKTFPIYPVSCAAYRQIGGRYDRYFDDFFGVGL
jgi:hypothetical protein